MAAATASTLVRTSIAAQAYDVLNQVLWLPSGSDRLRRDLVEALDLAPAMSVLELGCGTGLVTRHLVAHRAEVTAVDGSEAMLARARHRAPDATYLRAGVLDDAPFASGTADRVVLSFLLHELDPSARIEVLRRSAEILAPGGTVGILEWGLPTNARRARLWRSVVRRIEPTVAHDILDRGLDDALDASCLIPRSDVARSGGRARVVVAGLHEEQHRDDRREASPP